jgi:phosphoglycolate phosphatase
MTRALTETATGFDQGVRVAISLSGLADVTIVFDLDGTLVESAPDLVATLNVLLAQEGVASLPLAEARDMIGQGARALLAKGFAASGIAVEEPRLSELFDRFIAHYRDHIADASRAFPGVEAALDALHHAGARLAVCTNKRTDLSLALLSALGLADRFAAIVGPDLAGAAKPDPRHLLAAIERAGGRPDRALMVGDSASDAGAARAAGVPLILVSFGYTPVPARELGADVLIDHFDELVGACARLTRSWPTAMSLPSTGLEVAKDHFGRPP